jgi:peptidoglycan/xylan/chitin deacetylase (PgdA/CDA1 family)
VLLIVNYHHVREKNPTGFAGLHHIRPEQFRSQIEALGRLFDFPKPERVREAILGGALFRDHACLLTFDDGLRDHAEVVAPILDDLGISALFCPNTGPWTDGRLLSVHMAHLLSAAFAYVDLASDLEAAARPLGLGSSITDIDLAVATRQYRYDDPETARIKYYLNAVIPQALRPAVLRAVFVKRLGDDAAHATRHYLTPAHARDLVRAGHTLGLHSHTHLHLASAPSALRRDDLARQVSAFREFVYEEARPVPWISYPYGGATSFNDEVIAEVRALGCEVGLTMRRGLNVVGDLAPMTLARVDTNDVVGGKFPIPWEALAHDVR